MGFKELYHFLEQLQQNNNKDWMHAHLKEYRSARGFFIEWLDQLNANLIAIDPHYFDTPGKKGIIRINNNLLFAPHKPVYKDHFGAGLDQFTKQGDFYIQIGLQNNMIAGGYWRPEKNTLQSIREAIDYNGDQLTEILEKPSFKKMFGGLYKDQKLQRPPKGFSADHPYIDLLKNKTFAVEITLDKKAILSSDFKDYCIEVYKEMLPFRRYLREATSV